MLRSFNEREGKRVRARVLVCVCVGEWVGGREGGGSINFLSF